MVRIAKHRVDLSDRQIQIRDVRHWGKKPLIDEDRENRQTEYRIRKERLARAKDVSALQSDEADYGNSPEAANQEMKVGSQGSDADGGQIFVTPGQAD